MNTATQLLERSLDWMKLSNPFSKIVEDIEAYLAKQQSVSPETVSEQESISEHKESMCINGCKEACTYCLKYYGEP